MVHATVVVPVASIQGLPRMMLLIENVGFFQLYCSLLVNNDAVVPPLVVIEIVLPQKLVTSCISLDTA